MWLVWKMLILPFSEIMAELGRWTISARTSIWNKSSDERVTKPLWSIKNDDGGPYWKVQATPIGNPGIESESLNVWMALYRKKAIDCFWKQHGLYIISVPGHCGIECNMKAYTLSKKSISLGNTNLLARWRLNWVDRLSPLTYPYGI